MARLVHKANGEQGQVLLLRMGVNRLGRSQHNDFPIDHPTVSSIHCEITLTSENLLLKDCKSTNGTFLNDVPVEEAVLKEGQVLRLGDVELLVDDTEVKVEIPKFEVATLAPPIVDDDGSLMCRKHENRRATYQCPQCLEILCDQCVHKLRRRKGKTLLLCPLCSHPCQRLGAAPKKRKGSLLNFLMQTVKLPFPRKNASE